MVGGDGADLAALGYDVRRFGMSLLALTGFGVASRVMAFLMLVV